MDQEMRRAVSLFRFGIISSLVSRKGMSRGEQEARIRQIVEATWELPGSTRSSIARSTVLRWLSLYQRSGEQLESLEPQPRRDRNASRALDLELQASLIALRKENLSISLPVFVKIARARGIVDPDRPPSKDSLYRLFKREGIEKDTRLPEDRRRFETELSNDLWQSDCMHGPRITHEGKLHKVYLFAVIDDHSRLITNARFYLAESLECYRDCLIGAFEKRGLPRRLYVDNGSAFRSNALKYACARLGVALIHSRPYIPQGRGKIERFFLTVRKQFIPLLPDELTLERLNELLIQWISDDYHARAHSSTGQTPLERYLSQVHLIRSAPKDLRDYFRIPVRRKVDKDRTVTLDGRLYEAPVGLMGKTVTLLYHTEDPQRVEIWHDEQSAGFLVPLDQAINSRIRRDKSLMPELEHRPSPEQAPESPPPASYHSGSLFSGGTES
jgi:transposase InsO family protein